MATLATNVSFQCFGLDGKPLTGGQVYTYEAGTTTPKATYTSPAADVPNPNPVTLDQNGKAKLYLGDGAYRLRILDSDGALIDDINNISRYVTQAEFSTFQQTINEGLSQLSAVEDNIEIFINTAIGNQKGFANGLTPLDGNVKIPHVYLPEIVNNTTTNDPNKLLSAAAGLDLQQQITNAYGQQFGAGQTRKNKTFLSGTDYTNSTARPIKVGVTFKCTTTDVVAMTSRLTINGIVVSEAVNYTASANYKQNISEVILPGETFKFEAVAFSQIVSGWEVS